MLTLALREELERLRLGLFLRRRGGVEGVWSRVSEGCGRDCGVVVGFWLR